MPRGRVVLLSCAVGIAAVLVVLWRVESPPGPRGTSATAPGDLPEPRPAEDETGAPDLIVEVSTADRMPIEGARVCGEARTRNAVEAVTDARGRALIRHDTLVPSLVVRKDGYRRSLSGEQGDDTIVRFVLTPAPPVDGRVVFVDGTPVPGCAIRAWNADPYGEEFDSLTTDALGRFRIAGVPLCQPFLVEARLAGYGPVTVRQLPIEAPTPIVITLGEGAVIEGIVTDPEGSPRAGAQVAIVADGAPAPSWHPWARDGARAAADMAGRFRIIGLSAPAAHVVYAKDGPLIARAGPFAVAPGQTVRADLKLQGTGGLRVRLVDSAGRRRRNAIEIILREPEEPHLRRPIPAVGDAYEIQGLLPLPHEIWVRPNGGFNATQKTATIEPGRTSDVEVVLEDGRTIEGRVVAADGPLPGATVVDLAWSLPRPNGDPGYRHSYPDGIGEDGLFDLEVPSRTEIDLTITARGFLPWERRIGPEETGIEAVLVRAPHVRFRVASAPTWLQIYGSRFEPDGEGNFLVPLQAAGRPCDVPFQHAGSEYVVDKVVLRSGETRDLGLIQPVPRGVFAGRVLDPDGKPAPGALVERADLWSDTSSQRTDRSGTFRFEDHLLARTTLRVQADGFPDLWTIVDPRGHVNVELVRGAQLRGRVIDGDGEPFPGARVSVLTVLDDGSLDEDHPWEAEVDSLGRFQLLLPGGEFLSRASVDGRCDRVLGPAIRVLAGVTAEVEIRLPWSLKLWH